MTQTLSPKENELLKMLAEHMNDLLPREQALKKIWGSDTYFNGRSMDVYIAKLRKYLKDDDHIEIVNIHGNGFRLVVPSQCVRRVSEQFSFFARLFFAKMLIGFGGCFTAAGRSHEKTFLDQEWLVDFFQRAGLLSNGCCIWS